MYVIEWATHREMVWTGQGYATAPWLAKKYPERGEAETRAARIGGVVVAWQARPRESRPAADDGCPF